MTTTDPETERQLVSLAHGFASNEMRPVARAADESESFPWELFRAAAEVGLVAYDLPEDLGGGGVESLLTSSLIAEELGWGDSPLAGMIGSPGFFAGPIVAMGTAEQKERWVRPICGPEPPMCGLAITEPQAGSDASAILAHANPTDGGYVLNGQKTWITGVPIAEWYLVFATVRPGSRSKGVTAFVVEKGDAGFEVGRALPTMGSRGAPAGELFFQDCYLPEDRRIGEEGQGFRGLMSWFDRSRVTLAASAVGIGRAALEEAVRYASERETWGKKIHEYQAVSFRLADAKLRVDQARLMYRHAAELADGGEPFGVESAMAKIAGSEAASFAASAAVHTLGGYGYSREFPVEKWFRDAKLEEIYEGTNDIQRLIVARSLFPRS